jgi:hypothetical protein
MAESLPPLTLDGLLADLDNPTLTAYVYIGAAGDDGWAIAQAAERMIAAVRVYRVAAENAAAVRREFDLKPSMVGIVFGFRRDVKNTFTKAKAEDALAVFNAIWDSDG